jgi:hypothetical protein
MTASRLLPLLLGLVTLLPALTVAQVKTPPAAGMPLGLVLAAQGEVKSGGNAVTGGTLLAEGDQVQLADAAQLRFSLITSCQEATVQGPGKMRFEGGALLIDGARLVESQESPGCVKADRVVLSTSSQVNSGAVVVRGGSQGRMSPRAGLITSSRRQLVWDGPLADGRQVLVTLFSGEVPDEIVFEEETTGGSFGIPAAIPLVPGAAYAWSVEPAGVGPGPSLAGSFRVVQEPVATQLQTLRARAADAESWLRVAFFCEAHMLETDAADAYTNAVARDPGALGAARRLEELDLP